MRPRVTIKCVHITRPVITRHQNPGSPLSPSTATVSIIIPQIKSQSIFNYLFLDDCCVKVSAHQLLNHWLNDHKDPEPVGNNNDQEVLHIVNCQTPESGLSAALARLQSTGTMRFSPLHLILRNCGQVPDIVKMVEFVLDTQSRDAENNLVINTKDENGDTPLLLVNCLLDEGRFDEAKDVAERLLEHGADPETRNKAGWSVLAHSLQWQDSSLNLTRSLLHYGSPIMPSADMVPSQQSCLPLRVLLRSVIRSQSLTNARETLHLLGQVMSCQHPDRMKDHVLSSIVAEGSLLTSNGPEICSEIRSVLASYWSQPKPLLHLSLQASRKRLGLKRLHSGNLKAMLIAPRIQHYLSYQSTLPLTCSQKQTTGTEKTETNRNLSILRHHESLSDKIKTRLCHTTTTALKRK